MDFPLNITVDATYTYGMQEFKNTLYLILKNHIGTFIQSNRLGTHLDVHSPSPTNIEQTVSATIEQIPNTELIDLIINDEGRYYDLTLTVRYLDDVVNFTFAYEKEV